MILIIFTAWIAGALVGGSIVSIRLKSKFREIQERCPNNCNLTCTPGAFCDGCKNEYIGINEN